jgi:hypothetical protein
MHAEPTKRLTARVAVTLAATAVAALLAAAAPARAGSDYSHAQYQVTFSLNCNNPSAPCQNVFGLGGIWGWIALLPGGAANAEVTDCGHSGAGGGGAGAGHISFDSAWTTFSSPVAPTPVTPTDPNGEYIAVVNDLGLPPFPATYGHYSISFLGASGEITIAP